MKNLSIKNKKAVWAVVIIIAVITLTAIVWAIVEKKKKKKEVENNAGNDPGINSDGSVNFDELSSAFFPLKVGSENDYVRVLQIWLKKKGADFSEYGIDGKFGENETLPAVQEILGVDEVSMELFKSKIKN